MLVLTRRPHETIVIDGSIRVTVASIEGNKVRLAISAPDSVRVDRQEVHERIRQFTVNCDEKEVQNGVGCGTRT
jgi:carbon storage regulator